MLMVVYIYILMISYNIQNFLHAVTCYTEQLNCTGGANITLTRPTSIEDCCNSSTGGVSFDNGVECINCAGMYIHYYIAS